MADSNVTDPAVRLRQALPGAQSARECAALVAEAREGALADVKQLLRQAFRDELLETVVGQLRKAEGAPVSRTATDSAPAADSAPATDSVAEPDGADVVRAEIEEIKARLAENEQRRSGVAEPETADAAAASDTSAPVATGLEGWYLYGVVGKSSAARSSLPEQGVDAGLPVYSLEGGDLAAVVSRVRLDDFGEQALEENMNDLDWVQSKVTRHHDVLARVLSADSGLVPMRFCTIYRSEDRVLEVLRENRQGLHTALGRVAGRNEWGVKLLCDRSVARRWAEEHGESVAALKERLRVSNSGAAYFLQKRLDETLDAEAEGAADQAAQAIHDALAGGAVESRLLPLQERDTAADAVMVMNAAYLVDGATTSAFDATLEGLLEQYAVLGLTIERTGPWPAYNFVGTDVEAGMAT